jgi:hypothetical protein
MQSLYHILLVLHIAGFITAVGTLVSSLVSYNQFWRLYAINKEQGKAAFNSFLKTRTLGAISLLVTIFAGIGMEIVVAGAHRTFLWFKIKMLLIVLIIINGFLLGRITNKKLKKFLIGSDETLISGKEITKLKRAIVIFQYSQLFIFLLIIIMMGYRFS